MKKVLQSGTRAIVLQPFDLIARLCAMIPPRFNMIRFHGVCSKHAKLRSEVVPIPEVRNLAEESAGELAEAAQVGLFGEPSFYYLWTNQGSAGDPVWAKAVADGHEIGNYTTDHGGCVGGNSNVTGATDFIESNLGVAPTTMAAPNGTVCFGDNAPGMMMINRSAGFSGTIKPYDGSDRYHLSTYLPSAGQGASTYNQNIDGALSDGAWNTYAIHAFTGDPSAYQPGQLSDFVAAVEYAKKSGVVAKMGSSYAL